MKAGDLKRLKSLLREVLNDTKRDQAGTKFDEICGLLFNNDDAYLGLWDQEVLTQTAKLFKQKSPNPRAFGEQLALLEKRTLLVTKVNDLYSRLLISRCSVEDIAHGLSALFNGFQKTTLDYARIQEIRANRSPTWEKLNAFNEYLRADLKLEIGEIEEALTQIAREAKAQESAGKVNALLLHRTQGYGVVVPLSVKLVPGGKGSVHCLVPSDNEFKSAVERARLSAVSKGILADSYDIQFSLETTSAEYSGSSISLAAFTAIYSALSGQSIDRYTAFTGDINLDGSNYKVLSVDGIKSKLSAALQSGCRRVFLPKDNKADVDPTLFQHLRVEYVDDTGDVILQLHPTVDIIPGDTIYAKKLIFVRNYCRDKGWDLSEPSSMQDGVQFVISPAYPPELKLNLYYTGSHSPKASQRLDFQRLLASLSELDEPGVPIQTVNQTFLVKDSQLKNRLREEFSKLNPENHSEQYCEYVFRFQTREEHLVVKQYSKGKLLIQGRGGGLYKSLLNIFIPLFNMTYPNAHLCTETYMKRGGTPEPQEQSSGVAEDNIGFPYIGTDESGKGDYFGPLVVVGVWIDQPMSEKLKGLDVKDSKLLSDKRCRGLAVQIREICAGLFDEVELLPDRYNDLYEQFKKEGKNLNHLLAWGHARAIESILSKAPCSKAVADQFGDEKFILSKLMEEGRKIQLLQIPKAERYIAVAAASILARDRFLARIEKLGQKYKTILPKGASDSVVAAAKLIVQSVGTGELRNVAKLHHKTTQKVTEN